MSRALNFYTKPLDLNKLPHLRSCYEIYPSEQGQGLCFHRSVALVMDMPTAILTIATNRAATDEERAIMPEASPTPFLHAWVEQGDGLLAPTTIERFGGLVWLPREAYYVMNGASNIHRFTRKRVMEFARANGISAHLRLGRPDKCKKPFAAALLEHLGVPHRDDNGVLPA
jgi:hypothetical protein